LGDKIEKNEMGEGHVVDMGERRDSIQGFGGKN